MVSLRGHHVRDRLADAGRAAVFAASRRRRDARRGFDRAAGAEAIYELVQAHIPGGSHQLRSEVVAFMRMLEELRPEFICEIGTADGGTTVALGRSCPSVRKLVGVDLYVRRKHQIRALIPAGQAVALIDGPSTSDKSLRAVKRALAGERLDVLFIDGDHSYDGVRDDFLRYRELVRDGGLIAFHDIVPDSLLRHGVRGYHWSGEVPIFWRQLRELYEHTELIDDPDQEAFGIGVVRYSSDRVIHDLVRTRWWTDDYEELPAMADQSLAEPSSGM